MCRGIAAAVGCRIRELERPKSRLQSIIISPRIDSFRRRLVGRRIAGIRRVGKRRGDRSWRPNAKPSPNPLPKGEGTIGDCIVLEPRMTGLVLLREPPDREHVRLVFRLTGGRPGNHLLGPPRAGRRPAATGQRVCAVGTNTARRRPLREAGRPGESPCDELPARLGGSRRAIKVALLDQHALAGVGNLYASEILHRAQIHPATPCHRLRPADWLELHAALGEILRAAIRHQGSTLRDGTYRVARNSPAAYQLLPSRLSAGGRALPAMPPGADRADRPGPAVHVLLPTVPIPQPQRQRFITRPPGGRAGRGCSGGWAGLALAAEGGKLAASEDHIFSRKIAMNKRDISRLAAAMLVGVALFLPVACAATAAAQAPACSRASGPIESRRPSRTARGPRPWRRATWTRPLGQLNQAIQTRPEICPGLLRPRAGPGDEGRAGQGNTDLDMAIKLAAQRRPLLLQPRFRLLQKR